MPIRNNRLARAEPVKSDAEAGAASRASLTEVLGWIQIEIGAGMVLFPMSPEERAHNNACDRASAIIQNYREGFGLFQMTRSLKTTAPSKEAASETEVNEVYRK